MADLYRNKYRRQSIRAAWWDYGRNAGYFITVCTQDRQHFFGEVANGIMCLSTVGKLAHRYWSEIPNHFPYARLDTWVIMPNHMHGILIIDKDNITSGGAINRAATGDVGGGITGHHNPMLHDNVSRVIRWYKGRTTFESRKVNPDFAWQSRFYDHIIRDCAAWGRIRMYIENNPAHWKEDRFFV